MHWHGKTAHQWQVDTCKALLHRHTAPAPIRSPTLRPLLLVRSTGGGKSSVRDVCGFLCGGITVTIVPLLSLSADQTAKLIEVCTKQYLHSRVHVFNLDVLRSPDVNITLQSALERLSNNQSNKKRVLLFSSPQKIANDRSWQRTLTKCASKGALRFVAIDECHLYAGHGVEFRQEFGELKAAFLDKLETHSPIPIPILFMTATASLSMVKDLEFLTDLSFDRTKDFVWPHQHSGVHRRNIMIDLTFRDSPLRRVKSDLVRISRVPGNRKMIVYSNSRKAIMHLYEQSRQELNRRGIHKDIVVVHGNMYKEQKFHNTELFAGPPLVDECPTTRRLLRFDPVAYYATAATTSAGLDCHEVDRVLFHGFPPTIEDLLQCSGRCGRAPTATPSNSSFCMAVSLNSLVSLLNRIFILPKYEAARQSKQNDKADDTFLQPVRSTTTSQLQSSSSPSLLDHEALATRQWNNVLSVLAIVCLDDGSCIHWALERTMLHPLHQKTCDLDSTCGGACWRCRIPRISTPLDAPIHKEHFRAHLIQMFITSKVSSDKLNLHKDVFLNTMIGFESLTLDGKLEQRFAQDVLGLNNNRTVRQRAKALILKCFAARILEPDVDGLQLRVKLGYSSNGNPRVNDDQCWKGFQFLQNM